MLSKKKICAGWDGNSHSAYIYKNIDGKKYCKDCAFRVKSYAGIPKTSRKFREGIETKKEETQKQFKLFLEIWEERKIDGRNYCEVTGKVLPREALSIYFDHLLEKGIWPEYRFDKRNIVIVDGDVHSLKTGGFPLLKHRELIDEFKRIIDV